MIKELEQFIEYKHKILTKFKDYLKDENISVEERWYTFKLHGNILGPIPFIHNDFDKIYNKYKLRDFYTIRISIYDDKQIDFVDILNIYSAYADNQSTLNLKNDLMKLGAWNVIY